MGIPRWSAFFFKEKDKKWTALSGQLVWQTGTSITRYFAPSGWLSFFFFVHSIWIGHMGIPRWSGFFFKEKDKKWTALSGQLVWQRGTSMTRFGVHQSRNLVWASSWQLTNGRKDGQTICNSQSGQDHSKNLCQTIKLVYKSEREPSENLGKLEIDQCIWSKA